MQLVNLELLPTALYNMERIYLQNCSIIHKLLMFCNVNVLCKKKNRRLVSKELCFSNRLVRQMPSLWMEVTSTLLD